MPALPEVLPHVAPYPPTEPGYLCSLVGVAEVVPPSAINQISFHCATLGDLRRAQARLAAAGRNDGTPINHGNAWSIYIRDIEGNPMELYVDSPWYTPQPCGEPLDLSRSDEEIYRQTEALCRARAGFEDAEPWRARLAEKIQTSLNEMGSR